MPYPFLVGALISGGLPKFRRPVGGRTRVRGLCSVSLSLTASQLVCRELPLSRQMSASWPFWDETLELLEEVTSSGQPECRSQGSSSELLWGNG